MRRRWHKTLLVLTLVFCMVFQCGLSAVAAGTEKEQAAAIHVVNLKTEYLENPMGIDTESPVLSWKVNSQQRAQVQSAYQNPLPSALFLHHLRWHRAAHFIRQRHWRDARTGLLRDNWQWDELEDQRLIQSAVGGQPQATHEAVHRVCGRGVDGGGIGSVVENPRQPDLSLMNRTTARCTTPDWKSRTGTSRDLTIQTGNRWFR